MLLLSNWNTWWMSGESKREKEMIGGVNNKLLKDQISRRLTWRWFVA